MAVLLCIIASCLHIYQAYQAVLQKHLSQFPFLCLQSKLALREKSGLVLERQSVQICSFDFVRCLNYKTIMFRKLDSVSVIRLRGGREQETYLLSPLGELASQLDMYGPDPRRLVQPGVQQTGFLPSCSFFLQ
jgi:hypothetical protein